MQNPTDTSPINESSPSKLQPMGFSDILDTIFSLYRKHFLLFLGILTLYFLGALVEYSLEDLLSSFRLKDIMVKLAGAPFMLISTGGIILATAATYLDQHITSSDALKQTLQRFVPICVCQVLWTLVWWGNALILDAFMPRQGIELALTILIVGIPFSLYFAVRWIFIIEIVLLENPSVGYAFKRSSELVRGTWGRVCRILILILLLSSAIHYIFEISIGLILSLTELADGTSLKDIIQWSILEEPLNSGPLFSAIMSCIHLLLMTFTTPIWVIGITLLYFDLRIRKEGFDIETQIDNSSILASPSQQKGSSFDTEAQVGNRDT